MEDKSIIYDNNPWMDFASYKTKDSQKFKGREEDILKFSKIVDSRTMAVLYADSGIGKTSFLNAGISPIYINSGFFPIHILFTDDVFDGTRKKHSVEEWLIGQIKYAFEKQYKEEKDYAWKNILGEPHFIYLQEKEELPVALEKSLWWFLHNSIMRDNKTGIEYKPFIIFDQFEEVFIKAQKFNKNDLLEDLFKTIEDLSNNVVPKFIDKKLEELEEKDIYLDFSCNQNYKVIFSLRKEYLSDFDYWTNDRFSITELHQNRMFLLPLTRDQARKVITKQPDSIYDSSGEKDSTHVYIKTLSNIENEIIEKIDSKRRDRIEPFILSVLCSRLFEYAKSNQKQVLEKSDLDTYDINTIIREFYEEKIKDIISNPQELAIFEELLVDEDGNRNRKKLKELRRIGFEKKYREKLEKAHLVRVDSFNSDELYVELIHDKIADAIVLRRKDKNETTKKKYKECFLGVLFFVIFISTIFMSMCNGDNRSITYQTKDDFIYDANTSRYGNGLSYNEYLKELHVKCNGGVFRNCPLLNNATFSTEKDVQMGSAMFASCNNLNQVILADSCESVEIGDSTFADCSNLRTICIDDRDSAKNRLDVLDLSRVRKIGREAFRNCVSISNIKLDSISEICVDAFKDCSNLKVVTLGKKFVQKLNPSFPSFTGCPNITFNTDSNDVYVFAGGFLIYIPDTTVVYANNAECDTTVVIEFPEILSGIRRYENGIKYNRTTFFNRSSISQNTSKDTIKVQPYKRYNGDLEVLSNNYSAKCTSEGIKVLDLSDCNNSNIGRCAFENCTTIEEIIFPKSLKGIGSNAFAGCANLKLLDLSSCEIERISYEAFKNCSNLERVILPRVLQSLGHCVFEGCSKLEEVIWNSHTLTSIPLGAFKNCVKLERISIPCTIKELGYESFWGCKSLKNFDFLNIRDIGDHAFEGSGLMAVVLPDTLNKFCMDAFNDCFSLKSIRFPSKVSAIFPAKNWKGNVKLTNVVELLKETDRLYLDSDSNLWNNDELVASFNTIGHKEKISEKGFYSYHGVLLKKDSTYKTSSYRGGGSYIPKDILVHVPSQLKKAVLPPNAVIGDCLDSVDIRKIDISESPHYFKWQSSIYPNNVIDSTLSYAPNKIFVLEQDSILYIPPIVKIGEYDILPEASSLKEIHIPFTEIGFDINVPDDIKQRIILYVPYGTKNKYLQNDKYKGFKYIEEDGRIRQIFNVAYFNLYTTWSDMRNLWALALIILVLLFFFSTTFVKIHCRKDGFVFSNKFAKIFFTGLVFFVTVLCTAILYFFIHCGLGEHEVIGLIFSLYLICAAILLYRYWILDLSLFN